MKDICKFCKSPPKEKAQLDPTNSVQIPTSLRTVKWLLGEESNVFSVVGDFDSKLVKK